MRLKIAIAVLALAAIGGGIFDRQATVAEAQDGASALTGDVIVKFKDGTTLAGVGAALAEAEAAPVQSTPSGTLLLSPEPGQSVSDAVAALDADPSVLYAEPDVLVSIDATPNDTYYGGYQAWHFTQINAPSAWDAETGAASTVIAVVDTGVQSVHPDLNDNMVAGANFVTVPISASSNSGGLVRVTTTTPHPYLNGEQVTISGHSVGGVNGTWTIAMPAALNISSSTLSGGTITVTTTSAHNLSVGQFVMVRGHSIADANGEWTVTAVPSSTQFRYSCSPDCTTGSGTGGVAKQATWFNLAGSTYTSAGTGGSALNTSPRDDEGHGTAVSGFAAAESNNGQGVAGVCWTCKIMPVKVLGATGSGSGLAVAAGIEWAVDNGADVVNLSLSSPSPSTAMLDAVNYAWNNGVVVVAASGNDGDTLDPSVRYPAKYGNAIAVGATDVNALHASFSNYGPELDIVAPGDGVTSTAATGFGDSGGWYATGSGTSFATPHVAGVIGLMISSGITDKGAIVNGLTSTATDAGTPNFDNLYGHGIVDAAAALGGMDTTPPAVNITSPADGATVSGTVAFNATASDASGVEKVRFWVDNLYLSFDNGAPYTRSWDTTAFGNGPHTLKVQAVDNEGNASGIVSINVTVNNGDATPPTVNITSPADGSTVSGTVAINATASDASGVEKVRFWVDNWYLSFDSSAPYAKNWDTTAFGNGVHTLKVQAVDNNGNASAIVTIDVTVNNADATPPAVNITSPSDGATVSGTVAINASASDASGIEKVRYWVDNWYLSFDNSAPYSKTWDTTAFGNGVHTLKVQAVDNNGNASAIVTINVTVSGADSTPPTVNITSPADGATVSGVVDLTASASDASGIEKVRFWVDNWYLGFDNSEPYTRGWDTAGWSNGVHTLKAQAVDNRGNATGIVTITVTVNN